MEFPDLGKQCSDSRCRQLDFLPVKCDGCEKIYCSNHYSYDGHNCPGAYKKNVQVPVCPLCNRPIPGKASELPDIRVSNHIDSDCNSDHAVNRRKKIYTNRCSHNRCKQKELVPIICDRCSQNFCLRHRHPQDHVCTPTSNKKLSKAGQAAVLRSSQNQKSSRTSSSINGFFKMPQAFTESKSREMQGNMSEDEALRIALQASMTSSSSGNLMNLNPSEHEDYILAKALTEIEQEASGRPNNSNSNNKSCHVV